MYALGIPISQYRRTTQVLGHESSYPIAYEDEKQDDDFYLFKFPNVDEYDFKKIVILLKQNGITTIGADNQLTERNIMKLVNILKEQEGPEDNSNLEEAQGIIDKLKIILDVWQKKQYNNDQERWEMYYMDILELVEDYEEETSMKGVAMNSPLNENLKKRIKKEIKKLMQE
jgi:hypothetical protein|tara:strand:- start:30 stop:545 length:516 start_codon:yes stop_codon:yes gene_type:complete